MKFAFLVLLLLALSSNVFAQHLDTLWTREYRLRSPDFSVASSLQRTRDGGFVMAVTHSISYDGHYYNFSGVLKVDAMGYVQWETCPDSSQLYPLSYAKDVRERQDGSFIAVGELRLQGYQRIWKLNSMGGIDWERSRNQVPQGVRTLNDGGFILYGFEGYSVSRADSNGNSLWNADLPASIMKIDTCEGGFIAIGATEAQGAGGSDLYLARLTDNGDTLWTRTYGTAHDEYAYAVCTLPDDGFLLAGLTVTVGGNEIIHTYLVRTNASGDTLWTRQWELSHDDMARDAILTYDNTIMLAVSVTDGVSPSGNTKLVNLNLSGDTLWTQDVQIDELATKAIVQTSDSGFAVLGNIGDQIACLVRLAPHRLGIANRGVPIARDLHLRAFPNPFNPSTTISFSLPREARARIAVFDLLGREVELLADKMFPAGEHRVLFNGSALPSGLYFARMQSGGNVATQKLLLLK